MDLNYKIHIVMGCYGYTDDGFMFCPGIENSIFAFDKNHLLCKEMMNYLDNCKLFDKPLYDYNAVRNFLARFRQKFESPLSPVWVERKYNNFQQFAVTHKNCGLILKLSIEQKNIQSDPVKEEKEISASNILKLIQK